MALFVYGCAWAAMSIFIFLLGCLVPSLRPKPPPRMMRRARKPRVRSAPVSPVHEEPQPLPEEPDDGASSKSAPYAESEPQSSVSSQSKQSGSKSKWSLSSQLKSRRFTPSPRSSLGSNDPASSVGRNSPQRFFPSLPMIESPTSSEDPKHEQNESSDSSRPGRHVRLPKMKLLKTLTRKIGKQKPERASSVSEFSESTSTLEPSIDEPSKMQAEGQHLNTTQEGEDGSVHPRPTHTRNHSTPGEVFSTTFVNPFRIKPRNRKSSLTTAEPSTPTTPATQLRKISGARRMLNSLQLTLASNETHTPTVVPDSPRSSLSSASTFSSPSVVSGSPRSVHRTQPYGPPYYAAMPGQGNRPGSRPPPRRATSLSLERPETVVEESGEEGVNALGLELGRGRAKPSTVPRLRHRATASESQSQTLAMR